MQKIPKDEREWRWVAVIANTRGCDAGFWFPTLIHPNDRSNRTSVNIDAFASRFSRTSGDLEWAKGIGSPGSAVSIAATLTSEGYYIGGFYSKTVNFDPYDDQVIRSSNGESADIFIARYQPSKKGKSDHDKNDNSKHLVPEETVAINLFPNPVDQLLEIEWKGFYSHESIEFSILDLYGKALITGTFSTDLKSVDVSSLSRGYYIFQARQQNITKIGRFIKK